MQVQAGALGFPHLRLETLHQDGHQQVEKDIVAKGHEGHKVEGGPGGGGGHAIVEDDVPVLLRENLQAPGSVHIVGWGWPTELPKTPGWPQGGTWNTVTMAHSSESKFFLSGTVSPVSVFRLNLQPNRCMPRMLGQSRAVRARRGERGAGGGQPKRGGERWERFWGGDEEEAWGGKEQDGMGKQEGAGVGRLPPQAWPLGCLGT